MDKQKPASSICFGEVLWDVLPGGAVPGGAPMNVAYHLNKLGVPATMISRVGKDDYGDRLLEFMKEANIPTTLVQIDDMHETSTVIAVEGEHHEMQYEILHPVAWDFIEYLPAFDDVLTKTDFFIFGSLAARSETSRNTLHQLLEIAQTKVLDINLRPPNFDQSAVEGLLVKSDILKLNENELDLVSDWHADLSLFKDKVRTIADRYALQKVIVTKGANGASYFDGETFYEHNGYKVNVADTIGSGDSFLAALLATVVRGEDPESCLDFACRVGAFVASKQGACPEYTFDELKF